jgi:NAD(P)-dependent dehydrogenase (short-subunit alcohol dehydrogenase family)
MDAGASYNQRPDLSGKVVIVTGSNTGIGRQTATK